MKTCSDTQRRTQNEAAARVFKPMSTGSERPRAIEVHIEELVLHGFTPSVRQGLGDAVKRRLQELLSDQSLPQSWRRDVEVDQLDAGDLAIPSGTPPSKVGASLAQAVRATFNRPVTRH